MTDYEFLEILNPMDDHMVTEANPTTFHRSPRTYRIAGAGILIAAAVAFVCVLLFRTPAPKAPTGPIAYAESMDWSVMNLGAPAQKVSFETDLSDMNDTQAVRVLLVVYGLSDYYSAELTKRDKAYEESCKQYEAGRITLEELLSISKKNSEFYRTGIDNAIREETDFLASIGAVDIKKVSYQSLCITIAKENLSRLNKGKCSYRVLLVPEDLGEASDLTMNDLYGCYQGIELTYMSLLSSGLPYAPSSLIAEITPDTFQLNVNGFLVRRKISNFKDVSDTYNAENMYGFDELDFVREDPKLEAMMSTPMKVFKDEDFILFLAKDCLYIKVDKLSVYRFEKVE